MAVLVNRGSASEFFRNKVLHQPVKTGGLHKRRFPSGNDYEIITLLILCSQFRLKLPECLSDNTSCSAAPYGVSYLFRGDYAKTVHMAAGRSDVAYESAVYYTFAFFEGKLKISVFVDAYDLFGIIHSLVGKSCSSLSASSGKHLSAVVGGHSLSEAVLHLSLTLFRLICSFHFSVVLSYQIRGLLFTYVKRIYLSAGIAYLLYSNCLGLSRGF